MRKHRKKKQIKPKCMILRRLMLEWLHQPQLLVTYIPSISVPWDYAHEVSLCLLASTACLSNWMTLTYSHGSAHMTFRGLLFLWLTSPSPNWRNHILFMLLGSPTQYCEQCEGRDLAYSAFYLEYQTQYQAHNWCPYSGPRRREWINA